MSRIWVCKECGNKFDPLTKDGDFNFNCPECGSELTAPIVSPQDS